MSSKCWHSAVVVLVVAGCGDDNREAPAAPKLAKPAPVVAPTTVRVTGTVIDRVTGKPVGNVETVLRAGEREVTARAKADGTFEHQVPPGMYRAFVRDANYMTVGIAERVRLDTAASAELAGAPDDMLMPVVDLTRDLANLELPVALGAQLSGTIVDPDSKPVAGAIVRLRGDFRVAARPVLGTDSAITDDDGRFVLRVPAGAYQVDAAHDDYAGAASVFDDVELDAGEKIDATIALDRGCIISGRVITADGAPANDGAIERLGAARGGFGPSGRIEAGRFRWTTTETVSVTLRAWPWRSPPSAAKTFDCRRGKRHDNVVLRLPDQRPDVMGIVVDAHDKPVPLAFIDVQPLGPIDQGQQERADSSGRWHVYDLNPGRYRITASAPGRGTADSVIVAPTQDPKLRLSGTGRIAGTTTDLDNGTLEVTLLHCGPRDQPQLIAHEPRIVRVEGGRFTIDRVPACSLTFAVRWRDKLLEQIAIIEPDHATQITVDVGMPRAKQVTGIVRDTSGNPVEGARVTAVLHERESATARTDADGRYTMSTHAGAQVVAGKGEHVGRAVVGRANVPAEQLDIVLDGSGL